MADIVNLRQARKRKARKDAEKIGDTNRALSGRGKAEKEHDRNAKEKARAFLDWHRRGGPDQK